MCTYTHILSDRELNRPRLVSAEKSCCCCPASWLTLIDIIAARERGGSSYWGWNLLERSIGRFYLCFYTAALSRDSAAFVLSKPRARQRDSSRYSRGITAGNDADVIARAEQCERGVRNWTLHAFFVIWSHARSSSKLITLRVVIKKFRYLQHFVLGCLCMYIGWRSVSRSVRKRVDVHVAAESPDSVAIRGALLLQRTRRVSCLLYSLEITSRKVVAFSLSLVASSLALGHFSRFLSSRPN